MKLCPKCEANVEGLIDHCDCCGASLDTRVRLFACFCHDFPECLGFSSLAFDLVDLLEPDDTSRYHQYLEKVVVELFCYPQAIIERENIRNRVYYSAGRKLARVTIVVDYNEFVFSNKDTKTSIVASAIHQGIMLLRTRLMKAKIDIGGIVTQAEEMLGQYAKDHF